MYELNLTLDLPFDAALEKVKKTLMDNHLGIVSDVDVQAIFKNKIDKSIPAYTSTALAIPNWQTR